MSLALFVCLALAHPVLPLQPSDAPEPLVQTAMSACLRKGTLGLSREMSNAPLANDVFFTSQSRPPSVRSSYGSSSTRGLR
jgi:hypothetical protein